MSALTHLLDQSVFYVPSFTLESGQVLKDVPVAYKTWGNLNETRDNVMIICHAFTGSSDVEDWYVNSHGEESYLTLSLGGVLSWAGERPSMPLDTSFSVPIPWVRLTAQRRL